MPAALAMDQISVDQSLVDAFLARVDRFVNNVKQFEDNLADLTNTFKSEAYEQEEPTYQETVAAEPEQAAVVTADDIDLDALLRGVDLTGGMSV